MILITGVNAMKDTKIRAPEVSNDSTLITNRISFVYFGIYLIAIGLYDLSWKIISMSTRRPNSIAGININQTTSPAFL